MIILKKYLQDIEIINYIIGLEIVIKTNIQGSGFDTKSYKGYLVKWSSCVSTQEPTDFRIENGHDGMEISIWNIQVIKIIDKQLDDARKIILKLLTEGNND